jgi:hypothetical protein
MYKTTYKNKPILYLMSDKRVIKVNPDIFKIPETKKKRPPKDKPIQVKTPKNNHNKSIRRKVLSMIREKQNEKLDRRNKSLTTNTVPDNEVKSEFDESLEYLTNLSKNNTTLKNYSNREPSIEYQTDLLNNEVTNNLTPDYNEEPMKVNIYESPKYGCLKNGNLPTYRNWMNTTRRELPNREQNVSQVNTNTNNIQSNFTTLPQTLPQPIQQTLPQTIPQSSTSLHNINPMFSNSYDDAVRINEIKQFQKVLPKPQPKKLKLRKKIYRRNFTIGRSKTNPKIAVLVSNKTIRKNIMNKNQVIKQTPIQDVRKFLIKRGLIKVGSVAPNEVLRKMYESASMMCGDLYNHNPDNLLYNYFNYNE